MYNINRGYHLLTVLSSFGPQIIGQYIYFFCLEQFIGTSQFDPAHLFHTTKCAFNVSKITNKSFGFFPKLHNTAKQRLTFRKLHPLNENVAFTRKSNF